MSVVAAHAAARPGGNSLAAAILFGFLGLSLAPIAMTDIPAMVDYPNHLARMSILMRDGTPEASRYYDVVWALYPNLAMDLVVPPLGRCIGIEAATRFFYLAGQMLIVSGAMALSFAVRGRAWGAGITATMTLYCVPFAWGFVNFECSLGLALWCLAAWVAIGPARDRARWIVHACAVALLFVAHLFALGLYGVAVALIECWRARDERRLLRSLVLTGAAIAVPFAIAGGVMLASGGSVGGSRTVWAMSAKLGWLFALNGFDRPLSMALTAALAMLGYVALRQGWLRLIGAGPWLAGGFALLYVAMPFRLFDTAFVDVRVLVAAALILPAFVTVHVRSGRARFAAAAIVAVVALINLGAVAKVQHGYARDYAKVIAALKRVDPGARILVADSGDAPDPPGDLSDYPMYHVATLAILYADGFVPTLFTYPGKQPIMPKPDFRALAVREGGPVPVADLAAIAAGVVVPPSLLHVADWPRTFDYLFVLRPDGSNPLPRQLQPVVQGGRFTLYRIGHQRPADTGP